MYALCLKNRDKEVPDQFLTINRANNFVDWTMDKTRAHFFTAQEEAVDMATKIIHAQIGDELGAGNNCASLLARGLLTYSHEQVGVGTLHLLGFTTTDVDEYPVRAEITAPLDFVNIPAGSVRKIKARGKVMSNLSNQVLISGIDFETVLSHQVRDRSTAVVYASNVFKSMMEKRMETDTQLNQQLRCAHPRFYADIVSMHLEPEPATA
jgi:hypothetical protein